MNFLQTTVAGFLLLLAPCSHAIGVRILAWDQQIAGRALAINDSKGRIEIQNMHPTQRTPPIQITVSQDFPPMLLALDKPDVKGNPAESRIIIPEGMKQPLMLLLPDLKSATGLRLLLIDDDSISFPWASIRMVNTTDKKLIFSDGEKRRILPANWTPQTFKPDDSIRNFEAQLYIPDQLKRPIYSAIWEHRANFRTLAFIVPSNNPRLGPIAVKTILEDRRANETQVNTNP